MAFTSITFLSSRKRGMTQDLSLIKSDLTTHIKDVSFRYFVSNEVSDNYMIKQGVNNAKSDFCQTLTHAICIDGSLPGTLSPSAKDGSRILFAIPYDYQFKNKLSVEKGKMLSLLKTFSGFTHIFAGSPFTATVLREAYDLKYTELIDHLCTPLAWDVNQPARQEAVRKKFTYFYPGSQNKKIISLLTAGKFEDLEPTPFDSFDLEAFLSQLGPDWFLFTNNLTLLEKASTLSSDYTASFGYLDHVLPLQDLLYVSDAMITNNSMLASCFASKRKPLYCTCYKENAFEKYVKSFFPAAFLKDTDSLLKLVSDRQTLENIADTSQNFCEALSYAPDCNPCEVLRGLLQH